MTGVGAWTRTQRLGYAASLSLTLLRAGLAIPLLIIAGARGSGRVVALVLAVGFVSDVYDGVVARHFGVATATLRRLDSAADSVFYLAAAICVWRLHPATVIGNRWLVGAVIGTLLLNHAIEFRKFGREASYHAWSAKAWGGALFVSLIFLFVAGDDVLVPLALTLGVLSHAENFAITLTLREWAHDVPHIFNARARRRQAGATTGMGSSS